MAEVHDKPFTVRFVSLGCPKNLVDSEIMMGHLNAGNFKIVGDDSASDAAVINTCGFIEDAKEESINTILELAQEKKKGSLKLLVVAGCLAQRYTGELPKLLPEVDAFIGTGDFSSLPKLLELKLAEEKFTKKQTRNFIKKPKELPSFDIPRLHATPFYSRYVKVSEGCSHACSFCTIPKMRGGLMSRTVDDVVKEVSLAAKGGVKEFNLIAQDLNEFGRDLSERSSLFKLFEELDTIEGDFWLRPLYMYPLQFPDRLVKMMAGHKHLVPYVDIPLQHISDKMLKSMNRGSSSRYIHRLIDNLRTHVPGITLRTTFIVGYPGESEKDFLELASFIEKTRFDRVGIFTYSDEEGTPAYNLKRKVPDQVKEDRRGHLMRLQQKISEEKNAAYVGKTLTVLLEGLATGDDMPEEIPLKSGQFMKARHAGQAPGIDGQVFIALNPQSPLHSRVGQFVPVTITDSTAYDLWGK
ncbi:30S ribosomal protein S12 methylthiotransferase RimO [bacterium]|nr:30S ribosomal protein S12 methylthiotransferase RimO [bacterium]